jgi:hypothetical protein
MRKFILSVCVVCTSINFAHAVTFKNDIPKDKYDHPIKFGIKADYQNFDERIVASPGQEMDLTPLFTSVLQYINEHPEQGLSAPVSIWVFAEQDGRERALTRCGSVQINEKVDFSKLNAMTVRASYSDAAPTSGGMSFADPFGCQMITEKTQNK